jgi:manganese-dependent ADP-ribose/CDP-alcohol diphosphatase
VLHCIGNHCLYNLEREKLNARLGIRSRDDHRSYFVHRMDDRKLAIAVLDAYDVSILGTREGEPQRTLAEKLLNDNNPNEEKNSNAGLEGLQRRFVKFGGGVSEKQLSWLERELAESRDRGEKVIVASHVCFHPETCAPTCLMWNFEEVLQVLQRNADVVVMTLAGHAHRGGYFKDEHGIHHRVAEAILECPIGSDCHAHLDFYDDGRIDIEGFGEFASQRLQFVAGAS